MTDTAKMDSADRLAELADLAGASREKVLAKLEAGGVLGEPRPVVGFAPSGASKVTAAEKARRRAKGKAQRKARARSRR